MKLDSHQSMMEKKQRQNTVNLIELKAEMINQQTTCNIKKLSSVYTI